ncbi:hypothetical protein BCN_4725 [Bacillus cereus NC7401]|nr:hypothetical protein BCN_4725 [Bacillus cereus NC7401]
MIIIFKKIIAYSISLVLYPFASYLLTFHYNSISIIVILYSFAILIHFAYNKQ